ncbi:MAG: amidohydrolase family protein, partial [Bacteroidetes bacterium]|nr:amidohydrolase family protein [Bacteroidota bacterium]
KDILDSLYPDKPVFLLRIDGHAALVNQKALDLAGITFRTKIDGGEVVLNNYKPTGLLIDNAVDVVKKIIPEFTSELKKDGLLQGQKNCFAAGLT